MSCSASAGTSHALTVRPTPRCFTLFVPPREEAATHAAAYIWRIGARTIAGSAR